MRESGKESRAVIAGRRIDTSTGRNSRPWSSEPPTSAGWGTGRGRESEYNRGEVDRRDGEEAEVGGPKLIVEGVKEGERRVKQAEGEEPRFAAVDIGCPTARHQLGDPPGRRSGDAGTGSAPVPSWATPKETWRAGSVA